MSGSQSSLEAEACTETHLEYFYKLCEIQKDAERLRTPTLNNEQLRSLRIQTLDDLNVDDASSCDFGPQYFFPFPSDRLPDLVRGVQGDADEWYTQCRAGTREEDSSSHGWCDAFDEAVHRSHWIYHTF